AWSLVALEEGGEFGGIVVEWRRLVAQLDDLTGARRDSKLAEVVLGVGEHLAELVPQAVGRGVRRLDRRERAGQTGNGVLRLTERVTDVRPEQPVAGCGASGEPGGLHGRERRLGGGGRLPLVLGKRARR